MADYLDHIAQAEHNEKLCQLLLNQYPEFRDWLITITFYAAIHFPSVPEWKQQLRPKV